MDAKRIIIDTLTLYDVVEVAKTDIRPIQAEIIRRSNCYAREVMQRRPKGELTFRLFEIKRPTGITWFVRFATKGYADYKRNGLIFVLYGTFYYRGGLFAVFPTEGPRGYEYSVFLPHFFERYNERYKGGDITTATEIIHEYFKYNVIGYGTNQPDRDGGIFTTTAHGAALGERLDGVYFYKTYIPPELMGEEQAKIQGLGTVIINNQ